MMKLLLPLLLIACSTPPAPRQEPSRLSGTVKVNAAIRHKPKAVVLDRACAALVEGPVFQEERQVDKDGGAPGVIVYIKRGLEGRAFEPPKEKILLQIKGHRFVPSAFGMRVGQELTIRNEEDHPYCVHALPFANKEFNVGLPSAGSSSRRSSRPPRSPSGSRTTSIRGWARGSPSCPIPSSP